MNPGRQTTPESTGPVAPDVESLLASVSQEEEATAIAAKPAEQPTPGQVQVYDFRNPMLLAPRELRKLRMHQEEFIEALAARLALHLRMEFTLKLSALQTIAYAKLVESWANPSHLTMFKMEPLRGISIVEVQPQFAMCMVDRLMGGSGQLPEGATPEMSEIEKALLEQTVQIVLDEWCSHWTRVKDLKPVILGYENNGRFVQTAPAETIMLVIVMEATLGEATGQIQVGFPYATLEPLIRHLSQGVESVATAAPATAQATLATATAAPAKWNTVFEDICIPVTAHWQGLEMTAREIVELKVGDVIRIRPEVAQQVDVQLGEISKFKGRPGSIAGQWAVELTQAIKR